MKKSKLLFFSFCLLLVDGVSVYAQVLSARTATEQPPVPLHLKSLPAHPRLFANADRMAAIKMQTDTVSRQLLYLIKASAENSLSASKIVYPAGISNMGTSRAVQGRIIALALAYHLLGDKRYLQKAKEELLGLAAIGNWGTGHFLDVGEASLAAGIGYDWLYNELTEGERKTIGDAIKNKALLPSLEVKETANNSSWVNGNFNWNPVCHGGLIVGALAIAETAPELSKQIVDRGIKNIPVAGEAYSPDGSFAEGPSYWSYGTTFYTLAAEALRTALGTTHNLEKVPGFLKTADYYIQMQAPSGEEYNYSDYHLENLNEPVLLWFAKELGRSDVAEEEIKNIARLYRKHTGDGASSKEGEDVLAMDRHTPLELLWWNPALLRQKSRRSPPLQWTASGLMPIGVMRSSWTDKNATYVALKGGTPDNSHGHMDAGSFILEADGIRWALDLGTENYNKMREAKLDLWNYSQASNRWSTFRVGPEGHNILRFGGERQLIAGKGEVKQLPLRNGVMGAEADLTSLYANKAATVTRTVLLHPDGSVSLSDEWTTKDSAVDVSFQWLTKASVTKEGDGLLLQQDGKSLHLKVEQPSVKTAMINVEDVSVAKAVQDSPNPGLSRIVITMNTAANSNGRLFIRAYPDEKPADKKKPFTAKQNR